MLLNNLFVGNLTENATEYDALAQECDVLKHDSNSQEYDVFICYSAMDREWVKNTLLCQLESRQIKACIDYRDFLVGAFVVENITDAIYNSRKTVAVLSPAFLNSVYCKHELQTALSRMANHQVIPILYQPCSVPDILKDKTYLDWCHADVRPYFWEQLEKAIRREPGDLTFTRL